MSDLGEDFGLTISPRLSLSLCIYIYMYIYLLFGARLYHLTKIVT